MNRTIRLSFALSLGLAAGCVHQPSGRHSLREDVERLTSEARREADDLADGVKKVAKQEADAVRRFSKDAVPDAEMLRDRSMQEYRDTVVP
jgi:hypothetical protein